MKEIGILEIFHHWDCVYIISRICKTNKTNVTIFTTSHIYSQLKIALGKNISEYNFIIKKENETKKSFLKKVKKICNEKVDLLFIITIPHDVRQWPQFLTFKPKTNIVLFIHEIENWIKPKILFDFKNIPKTINNNLKAILRKIMLPRFIAINVMYPPMMDYVKNNTNYNKKVFNMGFLCENPAKKIDPKKISFLIHGRIKEERGDYNSLLDVFEKLFEKHENISLTLLGYPVEDYGKKIIEKCKKLRKKGYNINWFESFIDLKEWEESFRKSNIAICPLSTKIITMGQYINSGIFYDACRYPTPIIIPKTMPISKKIISSTKTYSDMNELFYILDYYIKHKKELQEFQKKALENSTKFSLKKLRNEFLNNIKELNI